MGSWHSVGSTRSPGAWATFAARRRPALLVGKALIIAAAVPLAIAKNGLRIFVIAELGTRVDRGFLDGNLHHHGGIVFLGIAVVVVVALIWFLNRCEVGRRRELRARLR